MAGQLASWPLHDAASAENYFLQLRWNQAGYNWWLDGRKDGCCWRMNLVFICSLILESQHGQFKQTLISVEFRLACKRTEKIIYRTPYEVVSIGTHPAGLSYLVLIREISFKIIILQFIITRCAYQCGDYCFSRNMSRPCYHLETRFHARTIKNVKQKTPGLILITPSFIIIKGIQGLHKRVDSW